MIVTRVFNHQLGQAVIRVYPDGHATFRRKRYKTYNSARAALTRFCGPAWEDKSKSVVKQYGVNKEQK